MVGFEVALRDRGPVYVTPAVPYVLARPIRPPAAALLLALFFLFFQSLLDLVLDLVELLGRPTKHPASPRFDGVLDRVGDRSGDANNVTDEVDRVRSQVAELPAQPKPLPPVLCGVVVLPSLRHRDPPPFASPRRATAVAPARRSHSRAGRCTEFVQQDRHARLVDVLELHLRARPGPVVR